MNKTARHTLGKAKTLHRTDDFNTLIMEFRDDISAFDGEKVSTLPGKGKVNNAINEHIMLGLESWGIPTHHRQRISDIETTVYCSEMFKVECVVRNYAAGGIVRRLGIPHSHRFINPIFEFFLKDDLLKDPMINESHIEGLELASEDQIQLMKYLSWQVNNHLTDLFLDANLLLIDFKLEFGMHKGQMILCDEFTPDGCRLWDVDTWESFDKDRYRRDMGLVVQKYKEVAFRLGIQEYASVV